MKIAISYFYHIRHFKPYMIPVSTAKWDPKWYHDWYSQDYTFFDKRGIINGLRCEELHGDESCDGLCHGHDNCDGNPDNCEFLQAYRQMLAKVDFDDIMRRAARIGEKIKNEIGFTEEPVIVFMVYETPSNPCSERAALMEFFHNHGVECEELFPAKT